MASRFLNAHRLLSSSAQAKLTSRTTIPASRTLSRVNTLPFHTSSRTMAQQASTYRSNGDNGDEGNTEGENNEWKHRAPYKVHDNDPNFHARYEASCHCGKVRYQLSREKPLDSKYCHCTTCQKLHGTDTSPALAFEEGYADSIISGAPFQWAAIFHKEDINFTHGHHDLGWYESSEKTTIHKLPCKVSCAYCRTPIMDEGRNMILLFPTLINFKSPEDRKNFEPT